MLDSASSWRMLWAQRSGRQQELARWRRSDPESSIATPSPLTLVSLCIGRGVRQAPLPFALSLFFHGRRLRKSLPPFTFDNWNRETFRFGEALHPGPCQRIVTVNPQGWSRMAPLLATMKEEVILVQETFLEPGKVAKAEYEAKAC
eukprot:833620-Amphidinium_carterae.1